MKENSAKIINYIFEPFPKPICFSFLLLRRGRFKDDFFPRWGWVKAILGWRWKYSGDVGKSSYLGGLYNWNKSLCLRAVIWPWHILFLTFSVSYFLLQYQFLFQQSDFWLCSKTKLLSGLMFIHRIKGQTWEFLKNEKKNAKLSISARVWHLTSLIEQ